MNYDAHIYLYAKGWYKVTNPIDDLKIIYRKRNGIDSEHLTVRHVISCLLKLTAKHVIINERTFIDFVDDIDPNTNWRLWSRFANEDWTFEKALINKCLSVLSLQEISDIPFDLPEANSEVLPLRQN